MTTPDLDLYYSSTPNGHKPLLMLEELGWNYRLIPVNLNKGDQMTPEFTALSPNNRIPALVDHTPQDEGQSLSIFESGAILVYLAERSGKFMPADARGRTGVLQWVFWQMAGLGPMAGQAHHFLHYAPVRIDYGVDRYVTECTRLYQVLNRQLGSHEYVAGDYSIADMAIWGWVMRHFRHMQNLDDHVHVKRWFETLENRPAVQRTRDIADQHSGVDRNVSDAARKILFKTC